MLKIKGLKTGNKIMVLTKVMSEALKKEGLWDDDYMIVDRKVK